MMLLNAWVIKVLSHDSNYVNMFCIIIILLTIFIYNNYVNEMHLSKLWKNVQYCNN